MRISISIIFTLYSFCCFAQVSYKQDSIQIKTLIDNAEKLSTSNDLEGIRLCNEALKKSTEKHYYKLNNYAYNVIGRIFSNNGDVEKSEYYLKKAVSLSISSNDKNMLCASYCDLGSLFVFESKNIEAIQYFLKSFKLAEEINNDDLCFYNLYYISDLYISESNIPKSFEYSFKALTKLKNKEKKFDYHRGCIYDQIGKTYTLNKDYLNGKIYLNKSIKYFKSINEDFGIANSTYDLCKNEYLLNKKASLDELISKSLYANKLFTSIAPESRNNINCLNFIVELFLKKYKFNKDNSLLNKAFEFGVMAKKSAEFTGFTSAQIDNYKLLAQISFEKENFKSAYEYLERFYELNDSLYSQESKNKLAKLESYKDIVIKDKELKLNKLQLQAKEKQKWFYIFGIGLLAVIGGLLFYQSRNRKKTNEKLQILNTELDQANKTKTRFFSILNHDLRGPVANLIHFLHLQKDNPELLDEETKARMQNKTISGAENLLSSMEDILLWSKGQMENFKPQATNVEVNHLFDDTKKVFSGYHKIKFEYHNPDNISIFTDENYLKTIVRNLTSNAINVFTTTPNPTIIWKAWLENGVSYLSITDNGPGASKEQFKALYDDKEVVGIKSGLGLHLIRDLAKAINCEIEVDSKINEGTTFKLKL